MTHPTSRDWLDKTIDSAFCDFVSIPLIDMLDEDVEKLYAILKKYKHRQMKESQP